MQNVQVLLQPTLIATRAECIESLFVGSDDGKTSSASRISICASLLIRALSSKTGNDPKLWVPKTTSTQGALLKIS